MQLEYIFGPSAMGNQKASQTVFPDTNSLLHYPPFGQVDWRAVCDAEVVKIVMCMEVIHELDKKKSDTRLSSRAERIIRDLRNIRSSGGRIRDGVTLEIFNEELHPDEFPPGSSPESGDDRIVYQVKRYAEKSGDRDVVVYTEDLGMALRCEAHGVGVVEPAKSTRLESPQSEFDKKYKAAITELNRVKNLQPVIEVRLEPVSASPFAGSSIVLQKPRLASVESSVALERRTLEIESFDPIQAQHPLEIRRARLMGIAPEDCKAYVNKCESYLSNYRRWLEQRQTVLDAEAREIQLNIIVENAGTTFGEDISIDVDLPPVFGFVSHGNKTKGTRPTSPSKPEPPEKPRPQLLIRQALAEMRQREAFFYARDNLQNHLLDFNPPGEPSLSIAGNAEAGFCIHLVIPKLNHHTSASFGPFHAGFKTWEAAKPFEVGVTVIAANIADKTKSRIPVLVAVQDE